MYLLFIFFNFMIFIFCSLFGRFLGARGINYLVIYSTILNSLLVFFIFKEVILMDSYCYIDIMNWINFDLLDINWSFYFDKLTVIMCILVSIVSNLVNIYSLEYMEHDAHKVRFISYLYLFSFFMIVLITSSNLVELFVGWEGVGICSYLLINFWYSRLQANKSAIFAVIVNKISDFFILLSFGLFYYTYHSLDFSLILVSSNYEISNLFYNDLICLLLLLGAVGKSAQVGLHFWLPEAMEGPTPVSALIHAATMVTAGVFLIVRFFFIFQQSIICLILMGLFGCISAFFAGLLSIFLFDLKKIIAFSTCSQLGYMFVSCSFYNDSYAIFHLFTHGFFKALLFLSAGYLIHALNDEQDIRRYGGLLKIFPYYYIVMLIGSFSLMGLPFFSGFFSKEPLIESLFINYYYYSDIQIYRYFYFIKIVTFFSILFTIIYSFRLIFYLFFYDYNGQKINLINLHYCGDYIDFALFNLAILSMILGFFFYYYFNFIYISC